MDIYKDKYGYNKIIKDIFKGYVFRDTFSNYQKISYHILSYPIMSYHILSYPKISAGANSQMLTNQAVLDPKVHGHTSRAPPVGIEPTPPAPKGAGYVRHDHSATVSIGYYRI